MNAEITEALRKIAAGSKLGKNMFEQRVRERKGRLTWWAVNVLQDNLDACEGTASAAIEALSANTVAPDDATYELCLAAGALIVATDGDESIRAERKRLLDAVERTANIDPIILALSGQIANGETESQLEVAPDDALWSLQFSNTPPSVTIWSAKPGHDPRNDCIAYLECTAEQRPEIGAQCRHIVERHNAALAAPTAPSGIVVMDDDAELVEGLRSTARLRLANPDLAIEWKAADRIEALASKPAPEIYDICLDLKVGNISLEKAVAKLSSLKPADGLIERVKRAGDKLLGYAVNGRPGLIADAVQEWKDAIAALLPQARGDA